MKWIHFGAAVTLALWAEAASPQEAVADAAPSFAYRIVEQPVAGFLSEMARDAGIRIDVTPAVRGQLQGLTLRGTVEEILAELARQQGLDAFRFNDVTYVSSRAEMTTRMTRLGNLEADEVMAALAESGLAIDGFPIRETADRSALAMSGPPKYLALAETVIESIPDPVVATEPAQSPRVLRVMRGNLEFQVPVQ